VKEKGQAKQIWVPVLAVILFILAAGSVWYILDRAQNRTAKISLPSLPDLSWKNETLTREIKRANREINHSLKDGTEASELGRQIGKLGQLYQANHFYDHAILCYTLAIGQEPENPRWPYLLASVRQERGESDSVLGLLEKTLILSQDYSPALLRIADIHFKNGDMDSARIYYERRLKLERGDPYALLGLSRIALKRSRWETARDYLLEAIRVHPDFGNAHRLLASIYEHNGNRKKMQECLDRASQCTRFLPAPDPWIDNLTEHCFDVDQLLVLGSKAITALDIERAASFFKRAKSLEPGNPQVHLALGRLCFMVGQRTEARGFFEEAIRLDAKSDEAYFQLGLILRGEGRLRKAKDMFLKALAFHPNNANVHNNLGVILLEQEQFQPAADSFRKALEIYPEHINAQYNLGLALWGLGNTKAAIEQYRRVLCVKPHWAIPANSLAWILATDRDRDLQNGEEAVKWAQMACEGKGRVNPEFLDTLAAALARAGRFEEAEQAAREGVKFARSAGDEELAREIEQRLLLYQSNEAFSE